MDILAMHYLRKNYYIKGINKNDLITRGKIMLFVQVIECLIATYLHLYTHHQIVAYTMLAIMYCNGIMYSVLRYAYIKTNIKENVINAPTNKYLVKTKFFLAGTIIFSIILIFSFCLNHYMKNNFLQYKWLWMFPIAALCYAEGAYMPCIVSFGKEYYYSGVYRIKYEDITRMEQVKMYYTVLSCIVLVKIYHDKNVIGFDKFFIHDYIMLSEKINTAIEQKNNNLIE